MMEYVKPDYEVMVFEANEYVAACPWVDGTDLSIGCSGSTQYLDIEINSTDNGTIDPNAGIKVWTADYLNQHGNKTQGMLYPVYQKNDSFINDSADYLSEFDFIGYGFSGNIDVGHPTNGSGELNGSSQSSSATENAYFLAGSSDWNSHETFDAKLVKFGGWVGSMFHLLTYVKSKNFS